MQIEKIRNRFKNDQVLYSHHARLEMLNDEFGKIYDQEVYEAILNGQIIREYLEDKPYPSVLIFGKTENGRPIHIVCADNLHDNISIIVTVYHPNPNIWINFKKRRKL